MEFMSSVFRFLPVYALIAFGASIVSLARGGHPSGADKAFLLTLFGTIVGGVLAVLAGNTMMEARGLILLIFHAAASATALVVAPLGALLFQNVQHKVPSRAWWIGSLVLVAINDFVISALLQ